ncbi:hypothetical protein K523DRAFT_409344 [Schizophyllum commune Tattone D]|nr:hypothetical protein K523DRAFT_409344 [Schizophyllum commune Tattone D]
MVALYVLTPVVCQYQALQTIIFQLVTVQALPRLAPMLRDSPRDQALLHSFRVRCRLTPEHTALQIRHDSGDTDDIAAVILGLVKAHIGGLEYVAPPGCVVTTFDMDTLLTGHRIYNVGDAFGRGTDGAVTNSLANLIFSDRRCWTTPDSDGYVTWAFSGFAPSDAAAVEERRVLANVYGFLLLCITVWSQSAPLPLSPIFFRLLLDCNTSHLTDIDFIRALSASVYSDLSAWPPIDSPDTFDGNFAVLLQEALNIQCSMYWALTNIERQNIKRKVFGYRLLGLQFYGGHVEQLVTHRDFVQLREGMSRASSRIEHIFHLESTDTPEAARDLVKVLFSRRLVDPAPFLDLVQDTVTGDVFVQDNPDADAVLSAFHAKVMAYFRWPGHVNDTLVAALVPEAQMRSERMNPVLRANLCLVALFSNAVLPPPDARATITFKLLAPSESTAVAWSPPPQCEPTYEAFGFHSCAGNIDVAVTPDVKDAILTVDSHRFNTLIHVSLLNALANKFNMA